MIQDRWTLNTWTPLREEIEWLGMVTAVQPRIRLTRSFDQQSHNYLAGLRVADRGRWVQSVRIFEPQLVLDAVGTTIADRPPHRSVRALLRIRLPPWMSGGEALLRIGMKNAGFWNPSVEQRSKSLPRFPPLLAAMK